MKKLLACFLAIIAFVGCSKESALDVVVGGDETYHVTVGIDEQTRAEISTIAALLGNDYELRYVLEIYENNTRLGGQQIQYSADSSVVFAVKLPPLRDYRFVAWADVVAKRTDESQTPANIYYNTSNLSEVSEVAWANNDLRDAFADFEDVDNFSSSSVVNLKLMRPFAKLRIVDNNGVTRNDVKTITVSYSPVGGSSSYYKYNAMCDTFISDAVATTITRTYDVSAIDATGADGVTLFTDFIFVPKGDTQFNVEVSLYGAGDALLDTKNFGSVAVNRNTLTTIKGDII